MAELEIPELSEAPTRADDIHLPSAAELRVSRSDDDLDPSDPRKAHLLDMTRLTSSG